MITLNSWGMSTSEVLQAATINAARCLDCDDKYGSIVAGKNANLFLVQNNPLIDLKNLGRMKAIFLFGTKIKDEVNVAWN